jgi:hypothetical protein
MNKFQILEDSVRNTFGRVMWSHKIQEKQADILAGLSSQIMWANIILASFTSAGVVSTVFLDRYWMKLASALVSFLSAAAAALSKQLDLTDRVKVHRKAATDYLSVKDRLQILLMMIHLQQEPFDNLEKEYISLAASVDAINAQAPQTTDSAVARASRALHVGKDDEITDDEIDNGLPQSLRKGITK